MSAVNGKKKTERHHWWPEAVSQHWKDSEGLLHWVLPSGEERHSQPRNFGVITNGHYIKLSRDAGEETAWDQNFEPIFDRADAAFPRVIRWLQGLERRIVDTPGLHADRFHPQPSSEEEITDLVECLLSLAIRSPMNRASAVRVAEHLRGPLPERERNTIATLNMRDCLARARTTVGSRGKFLVLFASEREFVFGDGFYSNLRSPVELSYRPSMLVPITPEVSVLYVQPTRYTVEPRLSTIVLTPQETEALNHVVQIYAREALFYRSKKPEIGNDFRRGCHLQFSDWDNPVDRLIAALPGVIEQRGLLF